MRIELLVSPGCPSWKETEERIKRILSQLAQGASVETIVVDSREKAQALRFPGSPTVRVNGEDIEPVVDNPFGLG